MLVRAMIALLTVSHGTSDPRGRRAIARLAEATHARVGAQVAAHAFVDVEQPDVPTALAALPVDATVVIVPLLLSRGYHLHHDIRGAAAASERRVLVAGSLGPDPRLAAVLARRLRETGVHDEDRVVLAAAGSSDPLGIEDAHAAAGLLAAHLGRRVGVGFLGALEPSLASAIRTAAADTVTTDDAAPIADTATAATATTDATDATDAGIRSLRVAVAGYLLAPGFFMDRAAASGADLVTPPLTLPDRDPDEELVAIAADRFEAALNAALLVTNH
jgi:sirohydrochlorin ferrochelatase